MMLQGTQSGEFGMALALGAVAICLIFVVLRPLMAALMHRIARHDDESLLELEARVARLEEGGMMGALPSQTEQRVAELEERLDFAERLLAQPRTPGSHGAEGVIR